MTQIWRTALQDPQNPNWHALRDHLWEVHYDRNFIGGQYQLPRNSVRLSATDWGEIKRLIQEREIPVTICNTQFGFSIGLVLWEPAVRPYPRTIGEPARPFITIPACALPRYERGSSFELGWEEFSPLVCSESNRMLLAANELEQPKAKSDYAY